MEETGRGGRSGSRNGLKGAGEWGAGMLSDLLTRLRALFRRNTVEHELDDELRFHFERHIEKLIASGVPAGEALRRARLSFGSSDLIKEEWYE
jgi:macrolide transport system ATP-binding/permease protein